MRERLEKIIDIMVAKVATLGAENTRLREALKPFAAAHDPPYIGPDDAPQSVVCITVRLGDLRAARAALGKT